MLVRDLIRWKHMFYTKAPFMLARLIRLVCVLLRVVIERRFAQTPCIGMCHIESINMEREAVHIL